jgi:hypothetical protein
MVRKLPEIVRQRRKAVHPQARMDCLSGNQLKDEIAKLTADVKALRRKLRAERYRTRRLVKMIGDLERVKKHTKQVRPEFKLGDYGEASAVLLAQRRFKSQNRAH